MATTAQVLVRPSEDIAADGRGSAVEARARRRALYASAARPAGGHAATASRISLLLNAGLLIDMPHLEATGAEGVGLFRTEIPFMVRDSFPDCRRSRPNSTAASSSRRAGGRSIFRTLDIGGDKVLPYLAACRRGESGDGLARDPHRARPAGDAAPAAARPDPRRRGPRPARSMFPMIAEVAEFERGARAARSRARRAPPAKAATLPRVGQDRRHARSAVAALAAAGAAATGRFRLGRHQRSGAVPVRLRPRQSAPRRPLRSAVAADAARCSREVVARCAAAGVPLSVCGEMAGNPLEAMVLIGLGFRTLSMAPPAIGPVKTMIRSLDAAAVRRVCRRDR